MKSVQFLIALVFIAFFVESCKKEPLTYDFDGTVSDLKSKGPVSGADVLIEQQIFNSTATNLNHVFAGDATTNSNGQYHITFERDKVTEFKFTIEKEGYFDVEIIETSNDVSVEDINTRDFEMEPIAYVRFDIENIDGMETDQLKFFTYNFKEGCEGCTSNGFKTFNGEVDTSFTYTTTATEYVRFFFTNESTGATTSDSVLTIHQDTVVYSYTY